MKKIAHLLLIVCLFLFISCSSDSEGSLFEEDPTGQNDPPEEPSEPDNSGLTASQELAIDYFTEIALGFEFGNASRVTRKWSNDVVIFIAGTPTDLLLNELEVVISDLNALLPEDSIQISTTTNEAEANFTLFMGTGNAYANFFPPAANFVDGNFGLFFVGFNAQNQITNANMYVDTSRPTPLKQRHLLREELTQALGLARDSSRFSESIFQSSFDLGCTTGYSNLDEILIQLLYDRRVTTNLNEVDVRILLQEIIQEFI